MCRERYGRDGGAVGRDAGGDAVLLPEAEELDLSGLLSSFHEEGFARLGPVLSDAGARALADRVDDLMTGDEPFPGLFYQHDSPTGRYEDLQFNAGWVGPSRQYRKLDRLELDPLFAAWIGNPLFERLAKMALGDEVLLYRAVVWNKAIGGGMAVPWHQDDGRFWGLDQAPFLQVWTALDDASEQAGCLEVVPGSHKGGLATPEGGTITREALEQADAQGNTVALPARRGECIVVHNHVWHRTGRNFTDAPRRALTVSFLAGDTRCKRKRRAPRQFKRPFEHDMARARVGRSG